MLWNGDTWHLDFGPMHNLCFQIKSHLTAHDGALDREVE